jgi:hypothetical protein
MTRKGTSIYCELLAALLQKVYVPEKLCELLNVLLQPTKGAGEGLKPSTAST